MLRRAVDTPVHYQWDPSSRLPSPDPGTAPNNCGPTSVVNIAHFYREEAFGIYATRRIAVTDDSRGTSVTEQQKMLEARGVPCYVSQPPLWAIHDYIGDGDRPILAGLDMSKVPLDTAGHPFRGKHAVEFLQSSWRNDGRSRGVLLRDPNFNRTYRTDPTQGKRWYPDWVIEAAMVDAGMWAVVPEKAKRVPEIADNRIDGDPAPMRYTSLIADGQLSKREMKANKPIRKGVSVESAVWQTTEGRRTIAPWGKVEREDLPWDEKEYGPVYLINVFTGNGSAVGYVKAIDLVD